MQIAMDLLLMFGGVAIFLYGMRQMNLGIEQGAGAGVRKLFRKASKNRVSDYGVGIGTTAIMQSSSATSIMTVGLAHADVVTVKQGAGIVLGAKVGTTLTAFLFALSGIGKGGFSLGMVFAATAFIGVLISYMTTNDSWSKIALFFIGFGMLFLGLEVMGIAIGGKDSLLNLALTKLFRFEIMQNPIMLVVAGMVFTAIIKSSTAATGVFIVFLGTGVMHTVDQSFFLVMGANIGTCWDGIMASLSCNANGKRIALFHVLTGTIGAVVFSIILYLFRAPITNMFISLFAGNLPFSLAGFNLAYNTVYTLALLVFLTPLVNVVTKAVKDKKQKSRQLLYIDDSLLTTPLVAIEQALKEVSHMAGMARDNLARAFASVLHEDMSPSKKIAGEEYLIDNTTRALASYFIKISSVSLSAKDEKLIGGLHHVISDIERIGDYAVYLAQETNCMKQQDAHFLPETRAELEKIYQEIAHLFWLALYTFDTRSTEKFVKISQSHQRVKDLIEAEREAHITRLSSSMYSVDVSKSLYSVLFSLQRVADHIVNIGFSIRSDTGSKVEAFESMRER
ncbi:MAG: Na/Pi cotransporter family protein [Clostridiales bacterium]|nr:Na/Pi cotransporter family protein [Clostridiales bacterium]